VYDIENKLVQVKKPGMMAQYAYDALGRRMSKTVNGKSTHYRYDKDNLTLEMSGQDSVTADYTFGLGIDNPLTMRRSGQNYFYIKDGLRSVMALTDDAGNVRHEYKYAVYGKIVDESGDTVENPFTYTSRERDGETGNYYYRARYFNNVAGRFLNEPIQVYKK
jgi:RHS repeat-associated protein